MSNESKMRVCPKCFKEYDAYPALSRRDNKTEICPACGTREALEDAFGAKLVPMPGTEDNWGERQWKPKYKIVMESCGGTSRDFMSGFDTWEEAEEMAESYDYEFCDENGFVWSLSVEEE